MSNSLDIPHGQPGRFLRRAEAAAYVVTRYGFPCSRQLLAKLATGGTGPAFRKAGHFPIYLTDDLDRWAQERMGPVRRSTSVSSSTGRGG